MIEYAEKSDCDGRGLDYDAAVAVFESLQSSLSGGDPSGAADLMHYPVSWRGGTAGSPEEFRRQLESIFTEEFVAHIRSLDPEEDVWCNGDGFTIGRGVFWGWRYEDVGNRIFRINGPGTEYPPEEPG